MPDDAMPWPIWRLWLADKGDLKDIQNLWTIDEVLIANDLLDAQEDAEVEAQREAQRASRKNR